jgi:transketolase
MQREKFALGPEDTSVVAESRAMALEVLQLAGSGHPGATLSLMPLIYTLYAHILNHDPGNPAWECRDQLILSCGHVSLAQYIQLHVSGYDITVDDLKNFRKLDSKTPGHPELGKTPGIETTTGPLGQGFANAVGIALNKAIKKNNSESTSCSQDSRVFVIASDGDIHEGITYEAASLAGLYKLNNLVVIYDSNNITIDGSTQINSILNTEKYFESIGWQVSRVGKADNGDLDISGIVDSINHTKNSAKPNLIIMESTIGWPAPNWKNSSKIHGNMLPKDEFELTMREIGMSDLAKFDFSISGVEYVRHQIAERKTQHSKKCSTPNETRSLRFDHLSTLEFPEVISTRKANALIIEKLREKNQWVIGGSADLTESNALNLENLFSSNPSENYGKNTNLIYGVREHAMSAISNGMALDPNNIVFCATYLVFADYQKPSVRLTALMNLPLVYVWTHDSVAVGADGPTHQPIDQIPMLRAIPNFNVIRPASANELIHAWGRILSDRNPSGLILSRQDLKNNQISESRSRNASRGAYIAFENENEDELDLIIIGTGSELSLCIDAAIDLRELGRNVRVVSMVCQEWFKAEPQDYQEGLLNFGKVPVITVEAASTFGWSEFMPAKGKSIGIDCFGESGDGNLVMARMGITKEHIFNASLLEIKKNNSELSK